MIPNRPASHLILSDAIELEWQKKLPLLEGKEIVSIYFGGGTPSLFKGVEQILERIQIAAHTEITIEANPEESSPEMFSFFRKIGINRLSLGVQSLDDRSLETLERIHTAARAKRAIQEAREAGFENISIDLMYDLPNQTEESFRYTLNQLAELQIQHLSLYNLTIEPHTPFFKRKIETPQKEISLRLLNMALTQLEEIGLKRYEISAFAKKGCKSRHNLGYWQARSFLGFGPSAFSYWEGERFRNTPNLAQFHKRLKEGQDPADFREKLEYPKNILERLAVALRVLEGVCIDEWQLPEETMQTLEKLKREGLLEQRQKHLALSKRGMLLYDSIATELI